MESKRRLHRNNKNNRITQGDEKMSLTGFYQNKQEKQLSYPASKYLYNYLLETAMAKQRLTNMFARTEIDRVVDEVC
jgi:hypothetical protein